MSMGGDVRTDIVEWLRGQVPHCDDPNNYDEWELRMLEAADEIERLREALQNCATVLEMESDTYTEDNFTPHARLCRTAVSMARAALGEGK